MGNAEYMGRCTKWEDGHGLSLTSMHSVTVIAVISVLINIFMLVYIMEKKKKSSSDTENDLSSSSAPDNGLETPPEPSDVSKNVDHVNNGQVNLAIVTDDQPQGNQTNTMEIEQNGKI